MKITKEVQQTVTVTKDIICNKCGESCCTSTSDPDEVTAWRDYDGLLEASGSGGYHSKHIGDMTYFTFSLCERCLMELFKTFKINAIFDPDDVHYVGEDAEEKHE